MTRGNLIFPRRGNQILLGLKKRRFGTGKYNGFGGKTIGDEDVRAAAIRELKEESGLDAKPEDLDFRATLHFRSAHKETLQLNWDVDVFFLYKWAGEPVETEEMAPKWHTIGAEPFTMMWADDPYWLPRALAGEKLECEFHFDKTGEGFEKMEVKTLVLTAELKNGIVSAA
jgi:8-oxo-dGTP diphosphatase